PARAARSLQKLHAVKDARGFLGHWRRTTMDIIGAAALIAVGIVLAAVLYGRAHAAHALTPQPSRAGAAATVAPAPATVVARSIDRGAESRSERAAERTAEVALREAELARREAELSRRATELHHEREAI